jgi:hypothetical protein
MIGLLSQIFRGALAGLQRFADWGRGAGSCACGMPLFAVKDDRRLWCQRCGFETPGPQGGWPMWCPSCKFALSRPENGVLFCPHCHYRSEWPPRTRAPGPRRGQRRRQLKSFGV